MHEVNLTIRYASAASEAYGLLLLSLQVWLTYSHLVAVTLSGVTDKKEQQRLNLSCTLSTTYPSILYTGHSSQPVCATDLYYKLETLTSCV